VPVAFAVSLVGGFCIGLFGRLTAVIVASVLYGLILVHQLIAEAPKVTPLIWFVSLTLLQTGYVCGTVVKPVLRKYWKGRRVKQSIVAKSRRSK
jgi:hypothetical protein